MICYRRELTRARQKQECSGQKKKKVGCKPQLSLRICLFLQATPFLIAKAYSHLLSTLLNDVFSKANCQKLHL